MNYDAAILNGEVGIEVIVRDSKGDVFLAVESHFPLTRTIELAKAITMFKGLSRAIEASISLHLAETDTYLVEPLDWEISLCK